MPGETTYVAISTDRNDRQIYAGPCLPALKPAPEGREWIEEFRAMAAGYWYGDVPEEWAEGSGTPPRETPVALTIHTALKQHLYRSTNFLADPPEVMGPEVVRALMRHERALNLLLRFALETYESAPPATVMEGTPDDNSPADARNTGKPR